MQALPLLISLLKARGYRFVTVSQLLSEGTAEASRA
jgi:peptidoglycan/xylan/chitin deacetylase (PgdA/CDA1 family)